MLLVARFWAAVLGLSLLLGACEPKRGWVRLPAHTAVDWRDDGTLESLEAAIAQSVLYFSRLPASARVVYGKTAYTPGEMIFSLRLFLKLRRDAPDQVTFVTLLREKFDFYESIAEKKDNLFTGYYEPIIEGRRQPTKRFASPVLTRPKNLVEVRLSDFRKHLPDQRLVGRVKRGRLVPFYTRRQIQSSGGWKKWSRPLAYVNEVDLYFLQVQGSGIVHLQVGSTFRVGYHSGNGRPYRSIGRILIDQQVIPREDMSMQAIRDYLRKNPTRIKKVLFSNPSYVFFRRKKGGPYGSLHVPLTPRRSLALDRTLLPKGGLAYLLTEAPLPGKIKESQPLRRFMVVQDTGGAIRGHGRGDVFWGNGPEAEWRAGHMQRGGRLILLVAKKSALPPRPSQRSHHRPQKIPARRGDRSGEASGH